MDLFTLALNGGKGKKKTARVENMIDQSFMWELKQFYNQDDCIQKCRKRKQDELIQHKSQISWWFREEEELAPIPIMNEERYQRALHEVLWCANDYLALFGFVGFFIRKDLGQWVKEKEKNGGILPFGVIEFGERKDQIPGYFVKRAKKSTIFGSELVFCCTDESKKSKYSFFVFSRNATFRVPPVTKKNEFYPLEDTNTSNLLPNSSFEALWDRWRRITELTITLDDANSQSCRPESFLLTKPLPETDITQVSEADRYLSDFLDEGGREVTMDQLQTGYEYVSHHKERIQCRTAYTQMQSQRYRSGKYVSLTEQRRMTFPRPVLTENLEVLPPLVTLDRGPAPKSLIDVDHLEETYEAQVCSIMCYPYLLFKAHSHTHSQTNKTSGGIGNVSQLETAKLDLDKTIQGQEELFQEIFTELYMRSYAFLDLDSLSRIPQTFMPQFQSLLEGMCVRLVYDHQSPKTDLDMQNLSTLYDRGVISIEEFRTQLGKYGFDQEPMGKLVKPSVEKSKGKSGKKDETEKKGKRKKESSGSSEGDSSDSAEGKEKTKSKKKSKEESSEEKKPKKDSGKKDKPKRGKKKSSESSSSSEEESGKKKGKGKKESSGSSKEDSSDSDEGKEKTKKKSKEDSGKEDREKKGKTKKRGKESSEEESEKERPKKKKKKNTEKKDK